MKTFAILIAMVVLSCTAATPAFASNQGGDQWTEDSGPNRPSYPKPPLPGGLGFYFDAFAASQGWYL